MFQQFQHFFTSVFEKHIGQFDILICQPAFLGRALGCENVADPVFGNMGHLEISFESQTLDERVDQTEGYIQLSGELALTRGVVFFNLFEKVQRSYVDRVQLNYRSNQGLYSCPWIHFLTYSI